MERTRRPLWTGFKIKSYGKRNTETHEYLQLYSRQPRGDPLRTMGLCTELLPSVESLVTPLSGALHEWAIYDVVSTAHQQSISVFYKDLRSQS